MCTQRDNSAQAQQPTSANIDSSGWEESTLYLEEPSSCTLSCLPTLKVTANCSTVGFKAEYVTDVPIDDFLYLRPFFHSRLHSPQHFPAYPATLNCGLGYTWHPVLCLRSSLSSTIPGTILTSQPTLLLKIFINLGSHATEFLMKSLFIAVYHSMAISVFQE